MDYKRAYKLLDKLFEKLAVGNHETAVALRIAMDNLVKKNKSMHLGCPERGEHVNLCRTEETHTYMLANNRLDSIPNTANGLNFVVNVMNGTAQPCQRCLKRIAKDPSLVDDAKNVLKEEVFGLFWLSVHSL